jgi:nucleotide-binding universal stress UspA family protein
MSTVEEVEQFVPPKSSIGLVRWYHGADRNQEAQLAFVTKAGLKAVSLCVVRAGSLTPIIGVLHIDDPDLQRQELRKHVGAWDYLEPLHPPEPPNVAVLAKLADQLKAAEAQLAKQKQDSERELAALTKRLVALEKAKT